MPSVTLRKTRNVLLRRLGDRTGHQWCPHLMTVELCKSFAGTVEKTVIFPPPPLCDFGAERSGSRRSQRGLSETRAPLGPALRRRRPMRRCRWSMPANEGPGSEALPPRSGGGGGRGTRSLLPCSSPGEVHSHGQVAVAAVRVESLGPQGELHQGDVG